jgi:hypothetical protein
MERDEHVVSLIYEGARDDGARSLALAKVAERLGAAGAGLGIQNMKTHRFRSLGSVGIDERLTPVYQRLAETNIVWQAMVAR